MPKKALIKAIAGTKTRKKYDVSNRVGVKRGPYKKSTREPIADTRLRLWARAVVEHTIKHDTPINAVISLLAKRGVTDKVGYRDATSFFKELEKELPQVSTAGRRMKFGEIIGKDEFGRATIERPEGPVKATKIQQMTDYVEAAQRNKGRDSPYANVTTKMFENANGFNSRGEKIFDRLEAPRRDAEGNSAFIMDGGAYMEEYDVSQGWARVWDPEEGTRTLSIDEYENWLEKWRND